MRGSANRGITISIHFAQKLSAKHRGRKSYEGKSPRGQKSSGAKSSVVNVRGAKVLEPLCHILYIYGLSIRRLSWY